MDKSKIEWTDATWNPLRGCSPVSDGCRNCYAARVAYRFSKPGEIYEGLADWRGGRAVFNGNIKVVDAVIDQPLRWRRPRRIFVNSMSDLFHENVSDEFIHAVFSIMAQARHHTFQVLTKRPERMAELLTLWQKIGLTLREGYGPILPNVWLGTSVENQQAAEDRIPNLLACSCAVRFLSCEPLLGPVTFRWAKWHDYSARPGDHNHLDGMKGIGWVIAGGESGPHSRPMNAAWARSLRDQCAEAGVPFLFKQWGEYNADGVRVGKKAAGRILDGKTHDEFPDTA